MRPRSGSLAIGFGHLVGERTHELGDQLGREQAVLEAAQHPLLHPLP